MGVHILENGGSTGQIFVSFSNVLPASKTDWHIVGRCLINLGEQINEFSGGGGGDHPKGLAGAGEAQPESWRPQRVWLSMVLKARAASRTTVRGAKKRAQSKLLSPSMATWTGFKAS